MAFELPPLPYAMDALEPYISRETLEFHHGKHHAKYVETTNGLIQGTEHENKSLEDIIRSASGKLYNQAAQVWNHTFYWNSMKKDGGAPSGALLEAINAAFGSVDEFKNKFKTQAAGHFASGWCWLVWKDGKLQIVDTHDAANPLSDGMTPLLTTDVWEHAYYIDYRNKRPDYLDAFVNHLINWDFVQENFEKASK